MDDKSTLSRRRARLKRLRNSMSGDNVKKSDPRRKLARWAKMKGGPKPQQPAKSIRRVNAKPRADLKRVAESRRSKLKFFDLPAEIRNQIYEHALVSDHCVHMDSYTEGRQKCHPYALSLTPSLLRTCRRVYKEAILILLRRNTFILQAYSWMPECFFTNPAPLPLFSFVGHVIIKPPGYYTSQTCEIYTRVLSMIEHLQSCTIEIPDVNESRKRSSKIVRVSSSYFTALMQQ